MSPLPSLIFRIVHLNVSTKRSACPLDWRRGDMDDSIVEVEANQHGARGLHTVLGSQAARHPETHKNIPENDNRGC